jgi:hypothetical protein
MAVRVGESRYDAILSRLQRQKQETGDACAESVFYRAACARAPRTGGFALSAELPALAVGRPVSTAIRAASPG